ncbi:MAG: NERD domain-containing protein [Muribaculaceae bacterium]|nr:NERD domain-containing protein [Muribaculaceae bacterium]
MKILISILMIAFIVGMIYLRINLPAIKGKIGEKGVAMTLSFLPKNEYIVLNNLMYKNGSRSTQIDHVVISVYGIFVIETKNYKGWIFGNSSREYWTQNIWGNKYMLYNPLFQNRNHIKFLTTRFSEIKKYVTHLYSIIVFIRASKLHLTGDCDNVLWLNELNPYIKSHNSTIMTIEECHNIASILQTFNIVDKNERKTHNVNVRSAIHFRNEKINNGICPLCGGELIKRYGKYGDFFGCSNYPRCRYTC